MYGRPNYTWFTWQSIGSELLFTICNYAARLEPALALTVVSDWI